jgi:hypothetical protein
VGSRTVDAALKLLATDLTVQSTNASLFVKLHGDRLLMITEQAGEDARKRFVLNDN